MSDPLNPNVWMPHYFFMLQTIAHCYPGQPNAIMKRKYYDFVQNIPILMPCPRWQSRFCALLDEYPVTPFLGSRDEFHTWLYFIKNAVYKEMGKGSQTVTEYNDEYYENYQPKTVTLGHQWKISKRTMLSGIILVCIIGIITCIIR